MQSFLPLLAIMSLLFHHTLSQSAGCADNVADIMFLLDGSDSIKPQEWNLECDFVARVVNALDISPEKFNVGFTVYSTNIDSHIDLAPFRPKTNLTAVAKMLNHPKGVATNTANGIAKVRQTFQQSSRSNAKKYMILITDGRSNNLTETIREAQAAKVDGINIITVGIGNNVSLEELRQIAANPRNFYQTSDFAALRGIESDIRNKICGDNTTTQSSSVPPRTTGNNK